MRHPKSTYRIQFHKGFNFNDFEKIIPYLHQLGVDSIYASPIFKAMPGSTHGYDGVDPTRINPEIGTETQLLRISNKLKKLDMQWIQDIVPNHMAFHPDNVWLMDVLANGKQSPYADFFDIGLTGNMNDDQIMVPFLDCDLIEAIKKQQIKIIFKKDRLWLNDGNNNWPLNLAAYLYIFKHLITVVLSGKASHHIFDQLIDQISKKSITPEELQKQLYEIASRQNLLKEILLAIETMNTDQKSLTHLVDLQYYRLCNWQETNKCINYRRFFTVNALICLNIQNQKVFNAFHGYIFELLKKGVFQGLRIDHVDGLFNPQQYLNRLRKAIGPKIYLVVEKILQYQERLPIDWPVQGSTGYDFLAMVNNLLTNKTAKQKFDDVYQQITGKEQAADQQALIKKSTFLWQHMGGELHNLYELFLNLKLASQTQLKTIQKQDLKQAIAEFLIHCPVYRFYGNKFPLADEEQKAIEEIFENLDSNQKKNNAIVLLKDILLNSKNKDVSYQDKVCLFYQRCMQYCGPLMAKGIEDTLMYTYNRFIGHDEVGDTPEMFGFTVEKFHQLMIDRQNHWPLAMNATSTHDTKRGEDVRARLNVLTDIPEQWKAVVKELESTSAKLGIEENNAFQHLHKNDLYLIYQTLFGIWPMPEQAQDDLENRLSGYVEKALREAKKRSDWADPNEDYEKLVKLFTKKILNYSNRKGAVMNQFVAKVVDFGIINSLAQLILKFTCPGVPDCYQGTETWDFSLVDPDNRRAVNYEVSKQIFSRVGNKPSVNKLWKKRYNGAIKLWLSHQLFELRKGDQILFNTGEYIPLQTKGKYAANVFAFLRKLNTQNLIVILPLGLATLCRGDQKKLMDFDWKDTYVQLPSDTPSVWEDTLRNENYAKDIQLEGILIKSVWKELPISILKGSKNAHNRGAGVLLPISSVPSGFGIGDMGTGAYDFIDFLKSSKQKYWQVLPLNPIDSTQCFSPYSSWSTMAGNILFISPEELNKIGLLSENEVRDYTLKFHSKINYPQVVKSKNEMLKKAYQHYKKQDHKDLKKEFKLFCQTEKEWMDNTVLYQLIKQINRNLPWDQWPTDLKKREASSLKKITIKYRAELEELKWHQFIFYQQWNKLRKYANLNHIQIIGDLPFYVAYDSVDVWVDPTLFKLDKDLKIKFSAGVPPDYFNAEGQLWCMPTYNWKAHRAQKYSWWIKRLDQNLKFFDQVRLDHFRAFYSYWEVDAKESTAINGLWRIGPGYHLFRKLKKEFNEMPFVAEDLGSIDKNVTDLRDDFNLLGMKVLQFAFENDMLISPHLPHQFFNDQFIVYTGTHDNNTLKGWYKTLGKLPKQRINHYLHTKISKNNVHTAFVKLAFMSTAKICIVPMQDLLGLDETARMNTPASTKDNWIWRLQTNKITGEIKTWLQQQTELYGRD